MKRLKPYISSCFVIAFLSCSLSCSKKDSSNPSQTNTIQKQIVNTKWYYDSTIFWHNGSGFTTIFNYDTKTYLYFGADSTLTESSWNGITYENTEYPYVWNGDVLSCDYDFINDFHSIQIKNNQLIFADVSTSPQHTDTTGKIELLWWYYHR